MPKIKKAKILIMATDGFEQCISRTASVPRRVRST